jgi:ABC-type multidrug transport system fused ATPase/permease subunit
LPPGPLSVVFRDVSFAYDGDDTVLHGVDLALAPGEVLGLIGRSGSGKTTAGRLLARLYDAEEGSIELGGVGVRDVPLSELRGRVGVVSQDVQLMAGSVRDNLTLFDPSVPDEALLAALDKLSLAAWLAGLPAGLDSQVSAGEISAGEAQLLATARVLLKDPGLVVLDEATSRLDPATQRLVDGAMTALLQGRTAIVIAHRLSTLERADKVAVLDSGRLVEFGERASLLSDGASRFAQLHRMELEALLA